MSITQKSRYRVIDPETGEAHEHNRHDKAYDKAIEVGADWIQPPQGWEVMGFKVNPPPAPVVPNAPPTIDSTPAPSFVFGNPAIYSMSQHFTDDGVTPLTYSIVNALESGLSINATTGVLTYDGVGAVSTKSHQVTVDDGVNAPVTSLAFSITIVAATSDIIFEWDFTHPDLVVGNTHPFVSGNMGPSINATIDANTYCKVDNANPLTTVDSRYLHTRIQKVANKNWRTEISERAGQTLRDTAMDSVGGGHYTAKKPAWYGLLIRFDGYQNDGASNVQNRGHIIQFHNNISTFNSPRLSIAFQDFAKGDPSEDGIAVYMEVNEDNGGKNIYSSVFIDEADIIPGGTPVVRAFIIYFNQDTRSATEHGTDCKGIVRVFIDDNPTPVFEHGDETQGKNNSSAGGSGGKLQYIKLGGYKSVWKSSGSADGQYHEQSYANFVEMGGDGSRLAMLDALNWADRT